MVGVLWGNWSGSGTSSIIVPFGLRSITLIGVRNPSRLTIVGLKTRISLVLWKRSGWPFRCWKKRFYPQGET